MNKNDNHKLWGGRFEAGLEKWVEEFGASISFDQKMAEFDLKGSIAHVTMLGETGIITKDEADQIKAGLEELLAEYKAGQITFDVSNEDIHMNMESLLTAKIGPVAGKLHTARSRNDQVATDMHLYLKAKLDEVIGKLAHLREPWWIWHKSTFTPSCQVIPTCNTLSLFHLGIT